MEKGVGFNRNIQLSWLDTAAAFCMEQQSEDEIREQLLSALAVEINSPTNLRKTISILLNIWNPSDEGKSPLHEEAFNLYRSIQIVSDRLWLHYGMTLLAYPFFYQNMTVIGRLSRYENIITAPKIRDQLFAEIGQLGSLSEAVNRVFFSLRDWGILEKGPGRNSYIAKRQYFSASQRRIEAWLLGCSLIAQPAQEIPFVDLLNSSALYPFRFTVTLDEVRSFGFVDVQRQGLGLNMVRVAK